MVLILIQLWEVLVNTCLLPWASFCLYRSRSRSQRPLLVNITEARKWVGWSTSTGQSHHCCCTKLSWRWRNPTTLHKRKLRGQGWYRIPERKRDEIDSAICHTPLLLIIIILLVVAVAPASATVSVKIMWDRVSSLLYKFLTRHLKLKLRLVRSWSSDDKI